MAIWSVMPPLHVSVLLVSDGIQLPLIIKNGLLYLENYKPTERQMNEVTLEEFVCAKDDWNPSKLNDIEGAVEQMISQFSPHPSAAIDSFYNSQGNICTNKSDSKDDPVASDSPNDPVVSVLPNKSSERKIVGYRPKPKKVKKRKKGTWVNSKKVK